MRTGQVDGLMTWKDVIIAHHVCVKYIISTQATDNTK